MPALPARSVGMENLHRHAQLGRDTPRRKDHRLMAEMDTVEITQRHHATAVIKVEFATMPD